MKKKLAVRLMHGLTQPEKKLLLKTMESTGDAVNLGIRDIENIIGRKVSSDIKPIQEYLLEAERIIDWCSRNECRLYAVSDPDYPAILRELYKPPEIIFSMGNILPFCRSMVAIVGTRNPTLAGSRAAFKLGLEAGAVNIPVVSGLAIGIDQAAHSGALAVGGMSIGVLGSGFARLYPRSCHSLAREMIRTGGGLISEYPPFDLPLRWHFPERNRIISGLCRSIVVIEAPERSGSLITADFALDQGRDVFVHQAGIESRHSPATKRLAEEGAPVISSMKEVCADWGWNPAMVPRVRTMRLSDSTGRIFQETDEQKKDAKHYRFQDTRYTLESGR